MLVTLTPKSTPLLDKNQQINYLQRQQCLSFYRSPKVVDNRLRKLGLAKTTC